MRSSTIFLSGLALVAQTVFSQDLQVCFDYYVRVVTYACDPDHGWAAQTCFNYLGDMSATYEDSACSRLYNACQNYCTNMPANFGVIPGLMNLPNNVVDALASEGLL